MKQDSLIVAFSIFMSRVALGPLSRRPLGSVSKILVEFSAKYFESNDARELKCWSQ